jgi:phage tail tube protein FII
MKDIYLLTAVDARLADEPETSRAHSITKIALPAMELAKATHNPGGSVMEVEHVLPRVGPVEPKFEVKGIDTGVFGSFGQVKRWTFAGAYRSQRTGVDVAARCTIEGAVQSWEADESDPTEFQGCTHKFANVVHCSFVLDGKELFYVDQYEKVLRFNGVDHFLGVRNALGI